MTPKTERLELRLDPATLSQIDDWRAARPDLPSRAEAARQLLSLGLGSTQDEQLFEIARFNLLVAAKTQGTTGVLSPAYVYAWKTRVFPFFHHGAGLHQPFTARFKVTEEMLDELSKFADDRWREKKFFTFHDLESRYHVRSGRTKWDRSALIHACRYMYLSDSFDAEFWDTLLSDSSYPAEAKMISKQFAFDHFDLG